jgi:hypothetical protein
VLGAQNLRREQADKRCVHVKIARWWKRKKARGWPGQSGSLSLKSAFGMRFFYHKGRKQSDNEIKLQISGGDSKVRGLQVEGRRLVEDIVVIKGSCF